MVPGRGGPPAGRTEGSRVAGSRCPLLPGGFGNAAIKAAYEKAKASGAYERVERRDGEGRQRIDRHYALTNPQEYFAERTEAYFSRNDFFPCTRDDLQQHDAPMAALLAELWGKNH